MPCPGLQETSSEIVFIYPSEPERSGGPCEAGAEHASLGRSAGLASGLIDSDVEQSLDKPRVSRNAVLGQSPAKKKTSPPIQKRARRLTRSARLYRTATPASDPSASPPASRATCPAGTSTPRSRHRSPAPTSPTHPPDPPPPAVRPRRAHNLRARIRPLRLDR